MRPLAALPLLCALVALVLSLLCVFAGSNSRFITDADILTLNTSELGLFRIARSIGASPNSPFPNIPSAVLNGLDNLPDELQDNFVARLGIHDFYSAHVLTYCEGYYEPNGTTPGARKSITSCSNRTASNWFYPTQILERELTVGVSLEDLRWPRDIDQGINALRTAFRAMFIAYVVGIVATGLTMLASLAGIFDNRRLTAAINAILALLSFLALGIASGIVTAATVKATEIINDKGRDIGIAATRGNKFLGMTWAATATMLLATILWMTQCCVRRRKSPAADKVG
ncbi:MAG: hypothetical protein M1823_001698 [Watsoniomyces obsoletus]|nr:MAG: hypothetical protein M1823_001698 [Watsoniomyces obsoletus]